MFLFIRSGLEFHKNLYNNFSSFLTSSPGGLGNPKKRCINFDNANHFITVIRPNKVNFLLAQLFKRFSTLL